LEKISKRNAQMIFLSKDSQDPYINMLAQGCGKKVTDTKNFDYDASSDPIVLRGILKKKIIHRCLKDGRTFYYVDTGYFGNEITESNPNGWKYWHRIVKNDLQHNHIIKRSDDRFKHFNKKISPWKKTGSKILIAKPDDKPMRFYDYDMDIWLKHTIDTIRKHTDRPVEVRDRAAKRIDRIQHNTLQEALDDDVFALVTFNSVAAVESVFHGIPVFTLAPTNAAAPMGLQDLSMIETPKYPDSDEVYKWACHLAYGQFHNSELRNGNAMRMLING
jgi:hypothetical protein